MAIRPDLAELWSNLGLMRYELHEYPQAREAFRQALGINQSLFVPNLFLGLALLEMKRPREAVLYLLAAEKLNPKDTQAALALGRTFHILQDPARSRQWYQRAADLAPQNGEAWYGLGLAYFGLAESAGARMANTFARSAYVSELAADAFAEQGRLAEAIHKYRDLLASNEPLPQCSQTSFGFALLRNGDRSQADRRFQLEIASCPAARVGEARLSYDAGDREKALAILAELARSDRESFLQAAPRFWEGLDAQQIEALLAQIRQSTDDAALAMAAAIEHRRSPASPPERSLPVLAQLSEHDLERFASHSFFSGDFRAAAAASEQLRRQYPSQPAGLYWAVRGYQELGVAALTHAGDVEPDSPRIHALLGDVYQRRKMYPEAREEYSKILEISPNNIVGLAGLAAADFAEGKNEEARSTAEKALAQAPADGEINLLMAEILIAQHEYEKAESFLDHSLNARPDLVPRVHALRGRVFARTGRSKEAIAELTMGLSSDEDGSVHYQLGRLYQASGNAKAAAAAFEESNRIMARRHALEQEAMTPGR